jgi:histidyl-tRNA synthetase (EC 6.1.1.21)
VYILTVSESLRDLAIQYAEDLRNEGLSVETDLAGRGFGSQLGYADSIDADKVVILGENDLQNDEVTLKDMDSGKETKVDKDEIIELLAEDG